MSAVFLDTSTDEPPRVCARLDWDDPAIVVHVGRGSIHLTLDHARELAKDILAALPEPELATSYEVTR